MPGPLDGARSPRVNRVNPWIGLREDNLVPIQVGYREHGHPRCLFDRPWSPLASQHALPVCLDAPHTKVDPLLSHPGPFSSVAGHVQAELLSPCCHLCVVRSVLVIRPVKKCEAKHITKERCAGLHVLHVEYGLNLPQELTTR